MRSFFFSIKRNSAISWLPEIREPELEPGPCLLLSLGLPSRTPNASISPGLVPAACVSHWNPSRGVFAVTTPRTLRPAIELPADGWTSPLRVCKAHPAGPLSRFPLLEKLCAPGTLSWPDNLTPSRCAGPAASFRLQRRHRRLAENTRPSRTGACSCFRGVSS